MIERIKKDIKDYYKLGLIIIVYYVLIHICFEATCPLLRITGFSCPGCGMTRAIFFVCTGQFARAFYMNPAAFLIVLFVIYCGVQRYLLGKKVVGFHAGIIILFIVVIGLYIWRMYLFFPDRIPYVYGRGNYLEKLFPKYYETVRVILNQIRSKRL